MGKVFGLFVAVWGIVAKYPALSAGLANIIIVAGAQVGLHLSAAELASIAGAVAALFGVLVTAGVIPVTKVSNVKAGLGNKVPSGGAVLEGTGAVVSPPKPVPPVVVDTHATYHPEPVTEAPKPEPEPTPEPEKAKPFPVEKLGKPISGYPKGK